MPRRGPILAGAACISGLIAAELNGRPRQILGFTTPGVASEIDLFCTLVGGSDDLAEALLADPRLEAWPVQPEDPIAFDSDQINT